MDFSLKYLLIPLEPMQTSCIWNVLSQAALNQLPRKLELLDLSLASISAINLLQAICEF